MLSQFDDLRLTDSNPIPKKMDSWQKEELRRLEMNQIVCRFQFYRRQAKTNLVFAIDFCRSDDKMMGSLLDHKGNEIASSRLVIRGDRIGGVFIFLNSPLVKKSPIQYDFDFVMDGK